VNNVLVENNNLALEIQVPPALAAYLDAVNQEEACPNPIII
jgi:hypothetical protein